MFENPLTQVTFKRFQFSDTVNVCHMQLKLVFLCVFPAANVTRVRPLARPGSSGGVTVCRVVVSADR